MPSPWDMRQYDIRIHIVQDWKQSLGKDRWVSQVTRLELESSPFQGCYAANPSRHRSQRSMWPALLLPKDLHVIVETQRALELRTQFCHLPAALAQIVFKFLWILVSSSVTWGDENSNPYSTDMLDYTWQSIKNSSQRISFSVFPHILYAINIVPWCLFNPEKAYINVFCNILALWNITMSLLLFIYF